MREYYFEKMKVWQNARKLTNEIYSITKEFPEDEKYHLTNQMRRSSNSIKSNIAEGQGRNSIKDQIHFTVISYSSLIELLNHLITCFDQELINEETYFSIRDKIEHIGNQLNALKNSQEKKLINNLK